MFNLQYKEGLVTAPASRKLVMDETVAAIRMLLVKRIWQEGREELNNEKPVVLKEAALTFLKENEIVYEGDKFRKKVRKGKFEGEISFTSDQIKLNDINELIVQTKGSPKGKIDWKLLKNIPVVKEEGVDKGETDRIGSATTRRVNETNKIMEKVGSPIADHQRLEERLRTLYGEHQHRYKARPVYKVRTFAQQLNWKEVEATTETKDFRELMSSTDEKDIRRLTQKVMDEAGFNQMWETYQLNEIAEYVARSQKIDMTQTERLKMIMDLHEFALGTSWNEYCETMEENTKKALKRLTHIGFPTEYSENRRMSGEAPRHFGNEQLVSDRVTEYALATVKSIKRISQQTRMTEADAIQRLWRLVGGKAKEMLRRELGMELQAVHPPRRYSYNEIVKIFLDQHLIYTVVGAHHVLIKSRRDRSLLWEDYAIFIRGMTEYAFLLNEDRRDQETMIKATILFQLTAEQRKTVEMEGKRRGMAEQKSVKEIVQILDCQPDSLTPPKAVAVVAEDKYEIPPNTQLPIIAKVQTFRWEWIGKGRILTNLLVKGDNRIDPAGNDMTTCLPCEVASCTTMEVQVTPEWTVPIILTNDHDFSITIKKGQELAHIIMDVGHLFEKKGALKVIEHKPTPAPDVLEEEQKAVKKPMPQFLPHPDEDIEIDIDETSDDPEESGGRTSPEEHQVGYLSLEEDVPSPTENSDSTNGEECSNGQPEDPGAEAETEKTRAKRRLCLRCGGELCQEAHDAGLLVHPGPCYPPNTDTTDTGDATNKTSDGRRACLECGKELTQYEHDKGLTICTQPCNPPKNSLKMKARKFTKLMIPKLDSKGQLKEKPETVTPTE